MSVRKIRNSWWVDFRIEYKRYRKRSPENSRRGAEAYEVTLRQRLARGESLTPQPLVERPTFADFSDEWFATYAQTNNKPSEQRSKESTLRLHLKPMLGRRRLDDITNRLIEEYKAAK